MLKLITINQALQEDSQYLLDRHDGKITGIKTPYNKFNTIIGGFEWGTVNLWAGMSGSGKTAFICQLTTELPRLNTTPIEQIVFNFEMTSARMVRRQRSTLKGITVNRLLKKEDYISKEELKSIINETNKSLNLPITFCESIGDPDDIYEVIRFLMDEQLPLKYKGKQFGLVVYIDHTLLIKMGRNERQSLVELANMMNECKNMYRNSIMFIPLSQTNRTLDSRERLNNYLTQYPTKEDIFGSDAFYQVSDIVTVMMCPERLDIQRWGTDADTKDKIYWHILKNRDGQPKILIMRNELKFNRMSDYEKSI